jgi:hypothetical protein
MNEAEWMNGFNLEGISKNSNRIILQSRNPPLTDAKKKNLAVFVPIYRDSF